MAEKKKTEKKAKPAAKKKAPRPRRPPAPAPPEAVVVAARAPVEAAVVRPEYLRGVGRRKEAVAQVRLFKNGSGKILVNGKDYREYFPVFEWRQIVEAASKAVGQADKVDLSVEVRGGGVRGQAEAVRLGVARALLGLNPTFRRSLRKVGYLTRDARIKERKKYGLKRARRAPQWQKR